MRIRRHNMGWGGVGWGEEKVKLKSFSFNFRKTFNVRLYLSSRELTLRPELPYLTLPYLEIQHSKVFRICACSRQHPFTYTSLPSTAPLVTQPENELHYGIRIMV